MKSLLLTLLVALSAPLCLADPAPQPAASPAPQAATNPDAIKDEFLRFVLTKAENYSGKIEDAVGQAVDVATKEAPETVRQYLVFSAWREGIYFFGPLAAFLFCFAACLVSYYKADWNDVAPANIFCVIGGFSGFILFIVVLGNMPHLLTLIEIKVAPRIYIIEQVSQLLHR